MIIKQIALAGYDPKAIALTVAFFVGAFAFFMIRERINTKKGETGEDLAKVREVLKRLLPDYATYTTAYAKYKTKVYRGRSTTTTTTYYHYAIAFKPGALFIVPIKYSGGEVSYQSSGALITPKDLSKVETDALGAVLFGLDGKELCHLEVHAGNTKQDKYEPFNIQQRSECAAFQEFIKGFAQAVDAR